MQSYRVSQMLTYARKLHKNIMGLFTEETREKVKGVYDALSSVVNETLHIGSMQSIETDGYLITLKDVLPDDL